MYDDGELTMEKTAEVLHVGRSTLYQHVPDDLIRRRDRRVV
jgi:hypothetical protein